MGTILKWIGGIVVVLVLIGMLIGGYDGDFSVSDEANEPSQPAYPRSDGPETSRTVGQDVRKQAAQAVQTAMARLENDIVQFRGMLDNPNLTAGQREELQGRINRAEYELLQIAVQPLQVGQDVRTQAAQAVQNAMTRRENDIVQLRGMLDNPNLTAGQREELQGRINRAEYELLRMAVP